MYICVLAVRFSPSGWFGGFVLLFIDLILLFLHTQNATDWREGKKGKHTRTRTHTEIAVYIAHIVQPDTQAHMDLKLHANHLRHGRLIHWKMMANDKDKETPNDQMLKRNNNNQTKQNQIKSNEWNKRMKKAEKNNDGRPANMRFGGFKLHICDIIQWTQHSTWSIFRYISLFVVRTVRFQNHQSCSMRSMPSKILDGRTVFVVCSYDCCRGKK